MVVLSRSPRCPLMHRRPAPPSRTSQRRQFRLDNGSAPVGRTGDAGPAAMARNGYADGGAAMPTTRDVTIVLRTSTTKGAELDAGDDPSDPPRGGAAGTGSVPRGRGSGAGRRRSRRGVERR